MAMYTTDSPLGKYYHIQYFFTSLKFVFILFAGLTFFTYLDCFLLHYFVNNLHLKGTILYVLEIFTQLNYKIIHI